MGLPFTNLFASCCTSPGFVFGARFTTPCMALGHMCPLMCWLLSCWLCCFAVLADRLQVILGDFPGRCTRCALSATTWPLLICTNNVCGGFAVLRCEVLMWMPE